MNDLKKSLKLITYSVGVKRQFAMVAVFLVIGIIIEIVTKCSNTLGGFYIALVGAVPGQMLLLVTVPNAVKASPCYHKITVQMFAVLNFLFELFCYTIVVVIHGIYAAVNPERADVSMNMVFIVGMVVFIAQVLYPMMYKHYWITFFVLLAAVMALFAPLGPFIYGYQSMHFPIPVYVLGGYALVVLGMLGSMLVNHIFYKHELDPMTYKSMMKKIDGSF
ncbi:MAG: hypothetical protein ACI4F0_01975 [Agathobacter sp.]